MPLHPQSFVFLSHSFVRSLLFVHRSFVIRSFNPHPPWLIVTYHLIRVFVRCLFSFVCRLFVVRSLFVHHSFIIRSPFVRCSFVRCSFVVRSAFVCHSFVVRSTKSPSMADCYVPPHPRSFFFHSCLFVRSTTSPAMADCYVPPHPRFCLSFVRRSFVVCLSFVCRLFVVRLLFVRRSFIIRLSFVRSFVRSSFVRPPHPPWLIVMYRSRPTPYRSRSVWEG